MNLTDQAPHPPYEYIVSIPLTKGKSAIIDCEDLELVSQFKWHLTAYGYAATRHNKKIVYMHRLILGLKAYETGDHADGDKLNNRRCNLRPANKSENSCNWVRPRKDNKSGLVGVTCGSKGWRASITSYGKSIHVGYFKTPKEAATARDEAAVKYHGAFARLNFP